MRIWLTFLGAVLLSACQPNDPSALSPKQRLDNGEIIEFTKAGFRHGGCKDSMPDWKVRIADQEERYRVVLGKQASVINPGIYNCYRVGSRVNVDIYKNPQSSGVVEVTKISWARIEAVTKSRMKGKYFASSEQFYNYIDGIKRRLEYNRDVYVSIVDFKYIKGSAVDEKTIIDEDKGSEQDDGYVETQKDGDSLSRCKTDWTDILVNGQYHEPILKGYLSSWFQLGSRNCLKQGQTATIKEKLGDSPVVGTIHIKKVKKFKVQALDPRFFVTDESFDYAGLKTFIDEANKYKNEEFMTVIDFEVVANQQVSR